MTETTIALTIITLPKGGFVVREAQRQVGEYTQELFASTEIDEALHFIKENLGAAKS